MATVKHRSGSLEAAVSQARHRNLGRISQNADRIERLIHDLLDYTIAKQGRGIPIQPRSCDLLALCHQVADNLRVLSPDRVVRLSAQGDTRGKWDPDRALQVIANLVTNAVRYSPAGAPVTVTLEDQGDAVALTVHNGGPPIAPELQSTIFEAFQRGGAAAEASQPAGFGLGLYIVQQLVQAHGGTVAVRSDARMGTSFTVRWPRAASV